MTVRNSVDEVAIRDVLSRIASPVAGKSLLASGMVGGISIVGDSVTVALEVADPALDASTLEALRVETGRRIEALPGVANVRVLMTGKRPAPPPVAAPPAGRPKLPLPGIGRIIAVASGKGGVGKSTTAVNLALALKGLGKRVGILDADIYGPSMQRLLGVAGPAQTNERKRILPKEAYGLKVMSMGFLVPEDTAMIWRGPMVQGAIQQLLREVEWGELDFLVVDMPPGTGDAQLTLAQSVPLAGAVIVSTPQDLALIDASRGVQMFRKVEIPILGVVENMSTFICPNCQHETQIFGHGGAKAEATRLGVGFLGEIPLDMAIRETSDAGRPIVIDQPNGRHAEAYRAVAQGVLDALESGIADRSAPVIAIE
jgi:ATP-binding protein involved in chromosome partitioning